VEGHHDGPDDNAEAEENFNDFNFWKAKGTDGFYDDILKDLQ
jgi:hypothetical protein